MHSVTIFNVASQLPAEANGFAHTVNAVARMPEELKSRWRQIYWTRLI
jgi:hypothetical protein